MTDALGRCPRVRPTVKHWRRRICQTLLGRIWLVFYKSGRSVREASLNGFSLLLRVLDRIFLDLGCVYRYERLLFIYY